MGWQKWSPRDGSKRNANGASIVAVARLLAEFALFALLTGCVPADPPGGAPNRKQALGNGDHSPRRERVDDEDKSGVALLQASATPSASARPPGPTDPRLEAPFRDTFERTTLGLDWLGTGAGWSISQGRLCGKGARNHPAWLKRSIPVNARIQFDAVSTSPEGDLKAELWGDGQSGATAVSYTNATSYLTIFGGWKNHYHVLARLDEHATNRQQIEVGTDDPRARAVEPNRTYHFKVERTDGKTVRWRVDDVELFVFTDPQPLQGPGHDHFGFNNWDVLVCFDNLEITPL